MQHNQSDFRNSIVEKINEFKRVYRSNIPCFSKSKICIKSLCMDRKSIRKYSDKQLYSATLQMAIRLESIINDENSNLYEHKGLSQFINEIKTVLKDYIEMNNAIIHTGKYASRLYMNLIQEIHSAMAEKCKEIETSISQKIIKLHEIDHRETLQSLNDSLESVKQFDINLYAKLIKIMQSKRQKA
jgi:hypothetical protein